ncbi:hypothetical protein FALCPG4_015043 [Fusarium falciforme]
MQVRPGSAQGLCGPAPANPQAKLPRSRRKRSLPSARCEIFHVAPASRAPPRLPVMNVPPRTILVLRAGTAQRTLTRANRSLLVLLVLSVSFWELNRQLKRANADPDDAWRTAAQRASQQLRACGSGAALPATPGPAPALASFGEIAEKSPEERKIMALETIAEAARLWILNKPDEEEEEEEEEEDSLLE